MANDNKPYSRREREVMDIIYRKGVATVSEVLAELPDPPSYSAVRSTLSILESKGHLTHEFDGNRYTYQPTVEPRRARAKALDHLLKTFFDASPAQIVSSLIRDNADDLTREELDEITGLIERARKEGR